MVSLLLLKVKQEELIEFIMFETENFEQAKVTEENYQGFLESVLIRRVITIKVIVRI